jgi:peptide/nickel transport system permease protein
MPAIPRQQQIGAPADKEPRPEILRNVERSRIGRHPVLRLMLSRVAQGVFVIVLAILATFLLSTVGGDAADARAAGYLTETQRTIIREQLGLDQGTLHRFVDYVGGAVHGDFGLSYSTFRPAMGLLLAALPYTLLLVGGALLVSLAIGIPLAARASLRGSRRRDRALQRTFLLGQGLPEFWLALMLVVVFGLELGWFPAFGYSGLSSAVLPIATLAIPLIPAVVRLLRGQLRDAMDSEYVLALRAKDLPDAYILRHHAFRNAAPGFVTYLALQVGWLMAGTVVVETVFQFPGIGALTVSAVSQHDAPVVQAGVVVIAIVFVVMNLLADLLVLAIDPRVRSGRL